MYKFKLANYVSFLCEMTSKLEFFHNAQREAYLLCLSITCIEIENFYFILSDQ